jgi:predicted dehydrogenase
MTPTSMNVAVVGCGSMGSKHIKHLLELGHRVFPCEVKEDRLRQVTKRFGLANGYSSHLAILEAERLDAAVIATDTAMHLPIACDFARRRIPYYSEIPISDTLSGLQSLVTATVESNVVSMVGMVWRFHPAIQKIKVLLNAGRVGKVNTVSCYGGEYLPDWHPGEPYKAEYSALPAKGGGVIVTNVSGVDYLRFLFGDVENVFAVYDSVSHIKIEGEDFFMGILQFQNGVFAQVYSDYFQKPTEHRIDIVGDAGRIHWDHRDSAVKLLLYAEPSRQWEESPYELNDFWDLYKEEMRHFLSCAAEGKETRVPVSDNVKTVAVSDALKRSFIERRFLNWRSFYWAEYSR